MPKEKQHKIYTDMAKWWPLFSPVENYKEEVDDFLPGLLAASENTPETLLELGCGGGNNAFYMKKSLELTLTDISEDMLDISSSINPECEHIAGDMRTLRLGREFDLVFIHDAIMYATTPEAVCQTLETAFLHCRKGGAVLICPDYVKETFESSTGSGGIDGEDGRGLRYLEWNYDTDTDDDVYECSFAFLLREDGKIYTENDHCEMGLFPRDRWLEWLNAAGFIASSRIDPWQRDIFLAKKR